MAALFSLMFIRLWYLQVLDTLGVLADGDRQPGPRRRGPRPAGAHHRPAAVDIIVGDQVTRNITLSRVAAQQHPAVVGQLAALLGISAAQIEADLANVQFSLYEPVPILENAPLSDVLYIGEHASMFPGVSTVADTNRTYPLGPTGAQMLGYVGQITSQQLQANSRRDTSWATCSGRADSRTSTSRRCGARPGIDRVEVNAHGQVVGSLGETPPTSGDDVVTNIDAGLEQTLQTVARRRDRARCTGKVQGRRGGRPRPSDRRGARPRVLAHLRPVVVEQRDLPAALHADPGDGRPEQQSHRRPLHPGVDLQAGDGHRRVADGAHLTGLHLQRHRVLHDPGVHGGRARAA